MMTMIDYKKMHDRYLLSTLLLLMFVVLAPYALAYTPPGLAPEREQEFRDIADGLRCPTCTGISVLDSDAPFSVQIKDIVAEQVQAGKTRDEIYKFFVERYGPWILREPPKEGFHILAWIIPCLFLLGGPLLVWLSVWRRRQEFDTGGIRSSEAILQEFEQRLQSLRGKTRTS